MAFEAVLAPDAASPRRWRRVTVIVSVAAHVAALAIGVAYSFWYVDELPLPAVAVTLAGAPPPPPPPPGRRRSISKVRPKTVETPKPQQLVQPKEHTKPPEEKPAPDEKDDPNGQEGGEKGGVAGGVQGGVVGAPVPPAAPKMLGAKVAHLQLLINPDVDPYKVQLPAALERLTRSGTQVSAIVRVCVSAQGDVTDVKVLRGADPAIDPQIPVVLRRWRYRPYQVDGRPEPFCYNFRYEITQR
jgi:outer membrane biosynthesis protein TonB